MTDFFIIRHAEAEGNITRRMHGFTNGRLTPHGHVQLEYLQKRLAALPISAVYSSDLLRAFTTASAAANPHDLAIITDSRLREVFFGEWEDLSFGTVVHRYPEQWLNLETDIWKLRVKNAEPIEYSQKRFKDCLVDIAAEHEDETVAVFTHGYILQLFYCYILGINAQSTDKSMIHTDNTALAHIRYDNGNFELLSSNDDTHLPKELGTYERKQALAEKVGRKFELRFTALPFGIFKAYDGEDYVGSINIDVRGREATVSEFDIEPKFHGCFVESQIIGQALSFCREHNCPALTIKPVNFPIDATALIELGFTVTDDNFLVYKLGENVH